MMNIHWNEGELGYCCKLIGDRGNDSVGRDPKTVATYLRLQAASAFRDGEIEISARLGAAATAINEDARNNHAPDWKRAESAMLAPIAKSSEGEARRPATHSGHAI
jgi:hypothetical protein